MSEPDEEQDEAKGEERGWHEIPDDPEIARGLLRAIEGIVPGIVKRAASAAGVPGLLSEEGLRAALSENKRVPKEVASLLLGQVDGMRKEILRIVSREIRVFLENVDLGGELAKILTAVSFEIRTEVRFVPNESSLRPKVKSRVRAHGAGPKEASEEGDERRVRWPRRRTDPQASRPEREGEESEDET